MSTYSPYKRQIRALICALYGHIKMEGTRGEVRVCVAVCRMWARCRRRDVHCACCGGCSCPEGSPGGHRTPEPPPQCLLITITSTPAATASCPAHGHYGTAPGAAASQQGRLRAIRGTQWILGGPLQASETHPSTPQSHEPANQGEFQITAPLALRACTHSTALKHTEQPSPTGSFVRVGCRPRGLPGLQ